METDIWVQKLFNFVGIASVSTDKAYENEVREAADWVVQELGEAGFDVEVYEGPKHPLVVGRYDYGPTAPTFLVYGHYDVQPASVTEGWDTNPFEPIVRQGALYGRGASDNKGQILAHICALKLAIAQGLKVNVVVVVEGEEEIGSPNLRTLLEQHVKLEKLEAVLVSDTSTVVKGLPTVQYSLRGIVLLEVALRAANRNVHSGIFGGTTANAVTEAARLVARLHDSDNKVTIPGFYDDVAPMASWEKEMLSRIPFEPEDYFGFMGARQGVGESGYTTNERRWFRPTLEIHGVSGGYTGEGYKTIVPGEAKIKLSSRLVAGQDPDRIALVLEQGIKEMVPDYLDCTVTVAAKASPYLLDPSKSGKPLETILRLQEKHWGVAPVLSRHGGAIPIVHVFEELYGAKTILLALGSPDDAVHGNNEKMELSNFSTGIAMLQEFWGEQE